MRLTLQPALPTGNLVCFLQVDRDGDLDEAVERGGAGHTAACAPWARDLLGEVSLESCEELVRS